MAHLKHSGTDNLSVKLAYRLKGKITFAVTVYPSLPQRNCMESIPSPQ